MPYAGGDCRVDRIAVQGHSVRTRVVGRDEQQLVGALERRRERGPVGVVSPADVRSPVGEALGLGDVADGNDDLVGGDAVQQVVDGCAVERTGRSGDDDHREVL